LISLEIGVVFGNARALSSLELVLRVHLSKVHHQFLVPFYFVFDSRCVVLVTQVNIVMKRCPVLAVNCLLVLREGRSIKQDHLTSRLIQSVRHKLSGFGLVSELELLTRTSL